MEEERQPPSNMPLYATLLVGSAISLACLASWLGPALIWIIAIGLGLLALSGIHYWMWGRGMSESEDQSV
jgi:uncharacterized RDD family membrane protein YckC